MPKQKTHSGAKKRFKLTKNGLVKYQKTNKRHRLTQKDTKRKMQKAMSQPRRKQYEKNW